MSVTPSWRHKIVASPPSIIATTVLQLSSKEQQAQELLEKARKLRQEIDQATRETAKQKRSDDSSSTTTSSNKDTTTSQATSPWSLTEQDRDVTAYRFYVDIGREPGTWMEPQWGASGQRMEFSLDVAFTTRAATRTVAKQMVQDNKGRGMASSQSPVYNLSVAPFARLRGGFDRMKCAPGAYRLDTAKDRGQKTLRLFFHAPQGKTMGDVTIPKDTNLYISLPVLADSSLSRKQGIVSVRQYGWHTGFYTRESRIVGVVKAVRLKDARSKDGF